MTAYAAVRANSSGGVGTVTSVGLIAVTYQLKIVRVECSTGGFANTHRYTSPVLTGGTALTPLPMRQGGPASTATAKYNSTISGSGSLVYGAAVSAYPYTPPFDLIVAPGSAIFVVVSASVGDTVSGGNPSTQVAIYYEELRLAYSF